MTYDGDMRREPDLDDPAQALVHRAMEALREAFTEDEQVPRFAVVVECPPDGRIGIASTADDAIDAHRMFLLAAASIQRGMTGPEQREARRRFALIRERLGL